MDELVYDSAMEQAGEDFTKLPTNQRAILYLGGRMACNLWIARRAARILSTFIVEKNGEELLEKAVNDRKGS